MLLQEVLLQLTKHAAVMSSVCNSGGGGENTGKVLKSGSGSGESSTERNTADKMGQTQDFHPGKPGSMSPMWNQNQSSAVVFFDTLFSSCAQRQFGWVSMTKPVG